MGRLQCNVSQVRLERLGSLLCNHHVDDASNLAYLWSSPDMLSAPNSRMTLDWGVLLLDNDLKYL